MFLRYHWQIVCAKLDHRVLESSYYGYLGPVGCAGGCAPTRVDNCAPDMWSLWRREEFRCPGKASGTQGGAPFTDEFLHILRWWYRWRGCTGGAELHGVAMKCMHQAVSFLMGDIPWDL